MTSEPYEEWLWDERRGRGYLPLDGSQEAKPYKPIEYDDAYFAKYLGYSQTIQGRTINNSRTKLVSGWLSDDGTVDFRNGPILDVGIGCGMFVERMRSNGWQAYGTDISKAGLAWLQNRGCLWPEGRSAEVLTFWDTFEHIPEVKELLDFHKAKFVFISMPIYQNEEDCLRSKHFKPGEHCWYFTARGLESFMDEASYELCEMNRKETIFGGREDISSFVFRRR